MTKYENKFALFKQQKRLDMSQSYNVGNIEQELKLSKESCAFLQDRN